MMSFRRVPEPVEHARVLRYLATLRLPTWGLLVAVLGVVLLTSDGPALTDNRPIYGFVQPALVRAFSTFVLLLIPIGLPLLYFFSGLVAHIGIALTGGAPRSVGATMRAVGFALGPWLLVVGILDIALYLQVIPTAALLGVLALLAVQFLVVAGIVLASSHQISIARGLLVSVLPTVLVVVTYAIRITPLLTEIPGLPEPSSPYFVP
jgi:hypothetical protein